MPPNPARHSTLVYIECDIPDGMTLSDWRRARREEAVPSAMTRVLRRARRALRTRLQRIDI